MKTRELTVGIFVKIDIEKEKDIVFVYDGMDGYYGKFYNKEHGLVNISHSTVREKKGDFYFIK